jgi:hypothetical protein
MSLPTCHQAYMSSANIDSHSQQRRGEPAQTAKQCACTNLFSRTRPRQLRAPSAIVPWQVERLWEHTCFGAFVTQNGSSDYHGVNSSPSDEWTADAFCSYRDGVRLTQPELAPEIHVRHTTNQLKLDALLRPEHLPSFEPHLKLRLALSAVIEDKLGMRSCWARRHSPGKPDFHHPDAFAPELEPIDEQGTANDDTPRCSGEVRH